MKNRKNNWNLLFIILVILMIAFVGAHIFFIFEVIKYYLKCRNSNL